MVMSMIVFFYLSKPRFSLLGVDTTLTVMYVHCLPGIIIENMSSTSSDHDRLPSSNIWASLSFCTSLSLPNS